MATLPCYPFLPPLVIGGAAARRRALEGAVGVGLPGDLAVELADVLVREAGAGRDRDGDTPDGVVGGAECDGVVGGPALELINGAGDEDVLCESQVRQDSK